jgi:transcriptional regulator with XRE-family HTH domain
MDWNDETFGKFLKRKRNERTITVRDMAERLGTAVGSYCDFESGRRNPPDREVLDKIIKELELSIYDRQTLYDLAGKARSAAPPDLPDYINENKMVRIALRVAKDKASDEDWRRFIEELEKKG